MRSSSAGLSFGLATTKWWHCLQISALMLQGARGQRESHFVRVLDTDAARATIFGRPSPWMNRAMVGHQCGLAELANRPNPRLEARRKVFDRELHGHFQGIITRHRPRRCAGDKRPGRIHLRVVGCGPVQSAKVFAGGVLGDGPLGSGGGPSDRKLTWFGCLTVLVN